MNIAVLSAQQDIWTERKERRRHTIIHIITIFPFNFMCIHKVYIYSKLHHQNVLFKPCTCTDPIASTPNHTPKSTIYSFGFGILKALLASYW